jgi:proline iminopeptidase
LAQDRLVVFFDPAGTGRSFPAPPPYTIGKMIAHMEAIREHVGAERMNLLGQSCGGFMAGVFALEHPDRVGRIIDVAGPGHSGALHQGHASQQLFFPGEYEQLEAIAPTMLDGDLSLQEEYHRLLLSISTRQPGMRNLAKELTALFRLHPAVYKPIMEQFLNCNLQGRMVEIEAPLLRIEGRYDVNAVPIIGWHAWNALTNLPAGSRRVTLSRSGHAPMFEEPAAFVSAVKDFLA